MSAIRGLDEKHEHAAQRLARDTRPLGIRIAEFLTAPSTSFIIAGTAIAIFIIFPLVADLVCLMCSAVFLFITTRQITLPFKMPQSSGMLDYNDLYPGSNKPKPAAGIAHFANDRRNGEEVWFSNDDMRTHVLIFGSTGSGKTEALISIAFNSLVQGSGFIYIDGKGDNSLFSKIFAMARFMGREDDLLLINFMTGARDIIGAQSTRLSNTMNPFSNGSSSMLAQLAVSLMDSGSSGGSGDMWKGRAINFVESLFKVMVVMRDDGHILLDAKTIRDYFILEKLELIVLDKKFPLENGHMVPLDGYPAQILEPLEGYLRNLPGFNPAKKGDQAGEVREQHGFITMQLTRAFGSLADTYGHIIRTNLAEVDFKDVVLNRRILVVLLPALEKAPDELATLGKIIIASLKAMMASGLGDAVEGDYRDVILRKPTNCSSPYVCIMDEYGYYAVQGFAVVPAQARSLGFSAIFAGQDLPAFQKASKEEAASIGANCNIKICMKLEDPQETWEFFQKVAGETYVTNVSGFQMDSGSVSLNYMDTRNASVDRRQRIELLDLKDQAPGQMHIFFQSKIIRAEVFFSNPKPVKKMRINHFLKVEVPAENELLNLDKRLTQVAAALSNLNSKLPVGEVNEDIMMLVQGLDEDDDLQPFERGIAGLICILEHEVAKQQQLSAAYESKSARESMSAFTRIDTSPLVVRMIGQENVELFQLPMIRRGSTLENLKHIERLAGKTAKDAEAVAKNIIRDVEKVTTYPPEVLFVRDKAQYLADVNELISGLGGIPLDPGVLKEAADVAKKSGTVFDAYESLPELPQLPDLPDLPDLSDFADLPALDKLDSLKDLVDLPEISALPDLPDLAELELMLKELEESNSEDTDDTDEEIVEEAATEAEAALDDIDVDELVNDIEDVVIENMEEDTDADIEDEQDKQ
jgi:intracellular multiplication protein IcmO